MRTGAVPRRILAICDLGSRIWSQAMADDEAEKKRRAIESLRHSWHENLARDRVLRRFPTALALATYVRQRFRSDREYAEFSIKGAAKALNMHPRSVVRARNRLGQRGWIRLIKKQTDQSNGWAANRYILTGGPEDLDLENHAPSDTDDRSDPVT